MADRKKVVEHLYDCLAASKLDNMWVFVRKDIVGDAISLLKEQEAFEPEWRKVTSCTTYLMKDAIALLKEQETGVSPKEIKMYPNNVWACGNCGHVAVGSADYKAEYCPECGKKVQWGG